MKVPIYILFASLTILSCERGDEPIAEEPLCDPLSANQNITGTWKVIKLEIGGKLTDSVSSNFNIYGLYGMHREILISISDTATGRICGYTLLSNFVWADYEVNAEQMISFKNYNRTKAYADAREIISSSFEQNLQKTVSYCFSGSKLVLISENDRPVIILERVSDIPVVCNPQNICNPLDACDILNENNTESILNNSWRVVKQNISGELICVSAIPQYSMYYVGGIRIKFPDLLIGELSGSTTHNMMSAVYEIDGHRINFTSVGNITRSGEFGWGTAFHQNLRDTKTYCRSNDFLFFYNADGHINIVFVKQ